jgi:hypothetical protein
MAQLVGALAIIVSILYKAAQVKQRAADVRANIDPYLHSNEVEIHAKPETEQILAGAVAKASTYWFLNADQRTQFLMWLYSAMINFGRVYSAYNPLGVDSELFEDQRATIASSLELAIGKAIWNHLFDPFSKRFRECMRRNCLGFTSNRKGT